MHFLCDLCSFRVILFYFILFNDLFYRYFDDLLYVLGISILRFSFTMPLYLTVTINIYLYLNGFILSINNLVILQI